jgi:peptidyl-prolyl cis-trans isomerase SurA
MDMNNLKINNQDSYRVKKSFISIFAINFFSFFLGILLFFSHSLTVATAAEQSLDRIAAVVNSDIVMLSSVLQQAKRLKASAADSSNNQLIKQALEQLVLIKIQVQRGKALGIIVDDVMLNRTIENIARQNKLSLADFQQALQREGFEYKTFREEIRSRLIIDALKQRQSGQRSAISEQEVTDLIFSQAAQLNKDAQYQLQAIVIPAANGISLTQFNKSRNQAQQLRSQLLKQSNFTTTSFTTESMEWKTTTELPLAYTRALSLMGVNEISPIIHDSQGFHILKLLAKRGGRQNLQQQVHARHILIGKDNNQGLTKAKAIRQQLQNGKDFATLAKINSADKGSATNGGDLGWATPATYVAAFAEAVKTSPINSISQPIETKFGWHIIQVLERKQVDFSRDALRASAKSILSKKKNKDSYTTWLKGIRDDAFVEYRLKL